MTFSNGKKYVIDKIGVYNKSIDQLIKTYCHVVESTKENILQIFPRGKRSIDYTGPIYDSTRMKEANALLGGVRMEYWQNELPYDINYFYFH